MSHPARGPVGDGDRRQGDRRRPPSPTTTMHRRRNEAAFVSHPARGPDKRQVRAGRISPQGVIRRGRGCTDAGLGDCVADPTCAPGIAHSVAPANAGAQQPTSHRPPADWIPACAGMTEVNSRAGRISPQGVIRRGRGCIDVGLRDCVADPTCALPLSPGPSPASGRGEKDPGHTAVGLRGSVPDPTGETNLAPEPHPRHGASPHP